MKVSILSVLLFLLGSVNAQVKNVKLLDVWADPNMQDWYGETAFNEVWGFVQNGDEYAVIGSANGTTICKITDTNTLEQIFFKEGREINAIHRHYHDYSGYLYAVCDQGPSTLRIYDLHYLPDSVPLVYDDSSLLVRSHNIFIDTSSALLYACGVTTTIETHAMRVLDLTDPENPTFVYDYDFVDYVHDVYVRNDTAYLNAANEGLRVANFKNPTMPTPVASMPFYTEQGYNHSGWLSENGSFYIMCDETPGSPFKWVDLSDLSDLQVVNLAKPPGNDETMPHNVQLKDGIAYFSYYFDGLQIYDVRDANNLKQIAYYDTYPEEDINFRGSWGVYAFLPSERLLVSDRKYGLHLLEYDAPPNLITTDLEGGIFPNPVGNDVAYFYLNHTVNSDYEVEIYDNNGRIVEVLNGNTDYLKINTSKWRVGLYFYRYINNTTKEILTGKFVVG